MQIITALHAQDTHWNEAWLNRLLEHTVTAQIIVYHPLATPVALHHPRLVFWSMQASLPDYDRLLKDVDQRLHCAMTPGARVRICDIWHSQVRDMVLADFMSRSPYEFVWCEATAWPQYTLHQQYASQQLHTNDCVLWNHQAVQRTDLMLLAGSHTLRTATAERIWAHHGTGVQWINQNSNLGWSVWLKDWQCRVIEGDDAWQFY